MGAWGIKALERDEGLDVLDILKNEYVPEHPVMDLGEMIELMKEEVMLGSDFSQIDFLFDNTAMALAELYFQWKDNSKLDYDHEEAIWDKVTGFTASKEALAFLLRQLTDIKNEVPDEDGIREIVDLWKNEDSGEIAPAWLEHLNQLIDRLDSEQEARQMYIKKYWGNFIGGSDDSLNLVAFLEDQKKEEIPLSEIFAKIGLDKQSWDFRQTVEYLEFTHSDGVEMDFHFAIDVVTDLAAILLECSVSGSVNLQDLDEYNTSSRRIRITATPEEHDAMNKALADFAQNPMEYDLSEMMDDEEIHEMARDVEALRKELYEAAGRNRDYHVKAADVKPLLSDWKGADGCIATNRITVEGRKVGYCYREEPDGGWDSGWRFTAGDESDEYMDDPNNAGIYKLNTICNDDPDIIPLLNTPAPCAFERDENGVFQQIKDWKPDEDEEDPDMDILKQCQKWHEEDKHQKIVDALEAISAEERTPEMDMELARAYNNLADSSEPEGRKLLHQALELMQSHEEELGDTYSWNFRMGYAYYYLDQEGRALRHFEKALELHPGDDPKLNTRQDMEELIDSCKKGISLPQFWECFRERTENWWETFAEMEAELRQMMDEDKDHTRGAEIVAQMEKTLNLVFDEISFEIGFNGEKHELILTPEGDKVKLFELVYFQKHAPKEVLEHWNILVGRQPLQNIGLRTEDGLDISGEDVQIWLEEQGENSFAISAYCEKLLNAIPENWRNYRTAYALARALENYAIIGDHDEGTLKSKGDKALLRAIEVLESVREEGQNKAQWNMRMAYGYQYLYGQEEKAIPYAQRWAELDPEDENAPAVIRECKAEIRKRQRSRKKKAKFVPGDTPFEGFDLTNFWDDNWYALKEYVSDPPSDELIASVEEELGYKLPAAYIWLMKQHNGGIPVNTCYPCDEPTCWSDDHVAITGIFGIGREKSCSLCGELGSQFMIDEWEYPAIGVAICDCPSAGHDMIFLDYRACGPQGEPAVVHVDQENDYKITHLADSFEEFIRGLEHESLYDPDEDAEDLEDDADEEETDHKGSFAGSVLLSKAEWDKEQLIRDLREEWGIVDDEPAEGDEDVENSDDAVIMRVGNMMLIVTLFHGHIPDNEAEINAENNYMWPEAVEVAKAHKAHIMVAVLGEEEKLLERGKLFTKAMAVCCKQKYATGVYTSGVVFEPRFYEGLADMLKEDELPIFNWVWFGLYRSEGGLNGYTYGMDVFGKEEMEVLNTDAEPEELRDFLASLASYVLACDVTLQDGETIGFSADDKHTITCSPGISLPEEQMTLKIGYEPIKGDPEDDSCDHSDNDDTQDEEEFSNPEVYTEEEMEAVEEHIEQYFGKFENVFHELVSPDIHVDICVVPPSEERDYCTLVTMGMGAHRMNVPEELAEYKLERAELAIALPADWKLDQESMKDEKWYWPIRLLKSLARLPIASDTWLGFGHTMDNKENFAENTKLCAAILTGPQSTEEGGEVCTLPGGEEVNFYQVIPLYEDELDYKLEHDVDALLNKMRGISFVVNPTRQNAITRGTLSNDNFDGEMDDASYHLESIEEKELPIDPINAYNHMAIYLRWCMEHDLMGEDFLKEYSEVTKQVKADPANVDLREFIRDELDGCLFSVLFNQQGRAFAGYYYGEGDSPYYPADIDDYALKYFGPSRYHSNEFQQEAYLFIPFDEKYYQTMAQVIEERFENWQGQDFDEDTLEPSEVAHAIMEYLDCECTYFPSMADDDPIMSAYSYAQRLGVREGFVPVLIQADDETLLECLVMNADPEHDADCYEFDLKTVEEYRKKMLSAPVKDGKAILEELTGQRKEEAEDDDLDWEEEVLGEMEGGEPNDRFANYWNDDTGMTYPLILAKIPVKNPWEIFAYLPFGNWNECPDTPDLMAVAKYWFEQHGAIPAAMSHDELEFELPTPISKERAMEVAVEQYGFCPDLDQNEDGSIGSLADVLWQSTVWYFWWD